MNKFRRRYVTPLELEMLHREMDKIKDVLDRLYLVTGWNANEEIIRPEIEIYADSLPY